MFVYIFPLCSILIFEVSFVNHLSVKLISSIKIIIIIIIIIMNGDIIYNVLLIALIIFK